MPWFGPPVPPRGPKDARVAIVGEAPGREETAALRPFVGPSGQELERMLALAGIDLAACYVTNVFDRQPEGNNTALYGVGRSNASPESRALGPLTTQPLTYAGDAAMAARARLLAELASVAPNLVLALGNTACWALLGRQGIANLRGNLTTVDGIVASRPLKVLPTYHPAAVLRQW